MPAPSKLLSILIFAPNEGEIQWYTDQFFLRKAIIAIWLFSTGPPLDAISKAV